MSIEKTRYSSDNQGYFGLSLLALESYGAHLVKNRLIRSNDSTLFFEGVATPYYHPQERALTVEGIAKSPDFAVQAIQSYAKVAREMDELARPFAS